MKRDPNQVAWAAGLFEGEGSWLVTKGRSAQAQLQSTDEDVVRRFADVIGFGRVREIKAYGGGVVRAAGGKPFKRSWTWQVCNGPQVRALIELFLPHMGERRTAKAQEILAATEGCGSDGRSKYAMMERAGMSW